MSGTVNGDDGTYRSPVTTNFTHGSIRVILDQASVVAPHEAEEIGIQADKVMGRLVRAAFQVGSTLSGYILERRPAQGSTSTEGAAWQVVNGLHVRARVTVEVNRSVPEFILSEAVDLVLEGFRKALRAEMDSSYKAHQAEEEARKATAVFGGLLPAGAMAYLNSLLGEDTLLGMDGSAGMMVGSPFGRFGRRRSGDGFAQV